MAVYFKRIVNGKYDNGSPSYSQILDVEEEKQESASEDDNDDKEGSGTDFDDDELKELDELEFDDLLSYPRSRNGSMIQPDSSNLKQDTPKDSDTFKMQHL